MPDRPWVKPQEVRDYSDSTDIAARSDDKLKIDITRAEQAVIAYTNNRFDTPEYAEKLPEPVRLAVLLIAERYAVKARQASQAYKSETLDDWSYTASDSPDDFADLDLSALLDEYKLGAATGNIRFRMRRL